MTKRFKHFHVQIYGDRVLLGYLQTSRISSTRLTRDLKQITLRQERSDKLVGHIHFHKTKKEEFVNEVIKELFNTFGKIIIIHPLYDYVNWVQNFEYDHMIFFMNLYLQIELKNVWKKTYF